MRIFTVDSFTNIPFKGNPAGVCILEKPLSNTEYIDISQELNYSETAFVYKVDNKYHLKWFTPIKEVNLCGHATLASAKILFEKFNLQYDIIEFITKSGVLTVQNNKGKLEMNFPARTMKEELVNDQLLLSFLKTEPIKILIDNDWCLIELENDKDITEFTPNLEILLKHRQKAFIITAKSTNTKFDFISRFFGPAVGIPEDPVTGSAHCYLAKYWGNKLNKKILIGYQASKRGGVVECELINNDRVLLRGDCVIMSELDIQWKTKPNTVQN